MVHQPAVVHYSVPWFASVSCVTSVLWETVRCCKLPIDYQHCDIVCHGLLVCRVLLTCSYTRDRHCELVMTTNAVIQTSDSLNVMIYNVLYLSLLNKLVKNIQFYTVCLKKYIYYLREMYSVFILVGSSFTLNW